MSQVPAATKIRAYSAPAILTCQVRADGVAVVTIKDGRGAFAVLDDAFDAQLDGIVERIRTDETIVGAALVSGHSESFLLGRDFAPLTRLPFAVDAERVAHDSAARFARLRAVGKPIVAAVHGAALGGGFELALACSAIVAADDGATRFGFVEGEVGLLPYGNGLLRVAERAGLRVALALSVRGERFRPSRAQAIGLIDDVVPPAELLESAARKVVALRTPSRPPASHVHRGRLARLVLEQNPLGRRVLFAEARRSVAELEPGYRLAASKVIDVLARYAGHGFGAAASLEALAFGELVVSQASRRLVEVELATGGRSRSRAVPDATRPARQVELVAASGAPWPAHELPITLPSGLVAVGRMTPVRDLTLLEVVSDGRDDEANVPPLAAAARTRGQAVIVVRAPYTSRILEAYLDEAARLVGEGVLAGAVDDAMVAWGWRPGPLALRGAIGQEPAPLATSPPSLRLPPEEIQMRCVLLCVNEALICLGEGVLASPLDGDVGAVVGIGFPAFRGGPFRYVDAVGPAEVLRRFRSYESRLGGRWQPAPLLIACANSGERFYE